MRKSVGFVFASWLALACSCGLASFAKHKDDAAKAVGTFHELFNQGRFGDIHDAASEEFRRSGTREGFLELESAVRRKLGDVVATTNQGWRVNAVTLGTTVDLTQATRFQQGEAVESFRFVVRDGKAVLLAYGIQSNALILK